MKRPETKYARSGDMHIAYKDFGQGQPFIWVANWIDHIEAIWDVDAFVRAFERWSRFSRIVIFDQPGCGMSDPLPLDRMPAIEQWADGAMAVMDAVGIDRAVIGGLGPAAMSILPFAAAHPERITKLYLISPYVKGLWNQEGYVDASPDEIERLADYLAGVWGTRRWVEVYYPTRAHDEEFVSQWVRQMRIAASPSTAKARLRMILQTDVRSVLPLVRVPTLITHSAGSRFPVPVIKDVADNIRGARYLEFEGDDIFSTDLDETTPQAREIFEFLTGSPAVLADADRVLATVLYTDFVDSTKRSAAAGDHAWRRLLDRHDEMARRHIDEHQGRWVKHTGDGVIATFDGPARAVRCACAIRDSVASLGIDIRSGLHTGEVEVRGDDYSGIAMNVGSRVMNLATAGEVLVSSTVVDLVAGSGLEFEDRGEHELKGVPRPWRIYAVSG